MLDGPEMDVFLDLDLAQRYTIVVCADNGGMEAQRAYHM